MYSKEWIDKKSKKEIKELDRKFAKTYPPPPPKKNWKKKLQSCPNNTCYNKYCYHLFFN